MADGRQFSAEVALRTQMDVGPPKVRCRSTSGYEQHQYTFLMTATNKAAMKVFYQSTCSFGAETFEWDHPETDVTETWRFISPPTYTKNGPSHYLCTVEAEMLP
jgi:hypothetical protein